VGGSEICDLPPLLDRSEPGVAARDARIAEDKLVIFMPPDVELLPERHREGDVTGFANDEVRHRQYPPSRSIP
jgi:hypothetical protein